MSRRCSLAMPPMWLMPTQIRCIFSSAWLCQQSSWNRNSPFIRRPPVVRSSSVVRLWHRISLKFLHWFLSNFSFCFPWDICPDTFLIFQFLFFFIFYEYFLFSLAWNPMGAKISKRYSSYKSQPNVFKLLNFPSNGLHKTCLISHFNVFCGGNFKLTIVAYLEIKTLNYMEKVRSYNKTEWNLEITG